jgi:plastocyanin
MRAISTANRSSRPRSRRVFECALLACAALQAAAAAEVQASVRSLADAPVADAVVTLRPLDAEPQVRPREATIQQIDKEFVPLLTVVPVGSAIAFPNRDKSQHHVYSFSPAKRFELPLYAGTPPAPVVFDKPGVVVLGCNIHDWMLGYVFVTDTPYTAVTAADGTATLRDVPPGSYEARVWHRDAPGSEEAAPQRVVIDRSAAAVPLQWKLALKPVLRVRRAPAAGGTGYR